MLSTSSMTLQGRAASTAFVSIRPAATINAFHNVHARPRAHVPGSSGSIARNVSRLSCRNSVHAIDKSHAGSPTPTIPKSMIALKRPSCIKRFPALTSPWSHTGGWSQVALSAMSQTSVAASVSTLPLRAAIACLVSASNVVSDPPRWKLWGPGRGPSVGSMRCRAMRNSARSVANSLRSPMRSGVAVSPSIHW